MGSHSHAMTIAATDRSRVVRHSVLWLIAAALVMLAAAPAEAGHKHKHKKHHHHHDHYSRYYDDYDAYHYGYDDDVVVIVRPRHVYAPPPVVHYHRAPVVYAPPSFNLVFPIDLD